tara:strand:- start:194 stop:445 length:252 start_codon:yes stop_codon:yes gene_type:complete
MNDPVMMGYINDMANDAYTSMYDAYHRYPGTTELPDYTNIKNNIINSMANAKDAKDKVKPHRVGLISIISIIILLIVSLNNNL